MEAEQRNISKLRNEFTTLAEETVWDGEYGETPCGSFKDSYVKWLENKVLSLSEVAPKQEQEEEEYKYKECSPLEHEAGLMHYGECLICGEKSS